jgi:dTMP kinase
LDLDESVAAARLVAQDKPFDRFESEKAEFHLKVRTAFLGLAADEPDRFLVIDASQPIDVISEAIVTRLSPLLDNLNA